MRTAIPLINASTSIARYRWGYRIRSVARMEECTGAWSIWSAPRSVDEEFNSRITDSASPRTQSNHSLIDVMYGAPSNANASGTKVTSATRRNTSERRAIPHPHSKAFTDHCIKCTRIFFYKKITNIIFSFLREAYLLCSTYYNGKTSI